MADKNIILSYFNTNDKPTEAQYAAWITDTYTCIDDLALHITTFDHDDIALTKAKVDNMTSAITIFSASNGQPNIAIGAGALETEVDLYIQGLTEPATPVPVGYKNIVIGKDSYKYNTDGMNNICLGMYTSGISTNSNYNISVGHGNLEGTGGNNNITIGHGILTNVTNAASENIVLGSNCLIGMTATTATKNIVIGKDSINFATTASENIVIGSSAVVGINPNRSIFIGHGASSWVNDIENSIAIGYNATCENSNEVVLGNGFTEFTKLSGKLTFTTGTINPLTEYRIDCDGSIKVKGISTSVKFLAFGVWYLFCDDHTVIADSSAADVDIFLPNPTTLNSGHQYTIKKIDDSSNKVKISPHDGVSMEKLDDAFYTLDTKGQSVTFTLYNDMWYIINEDVMYNKNPILSLTAVTSSKEYHNLINAWEISTVLVNATDVNFTLNLDFVDAGVYESIGKTLTIKKTDSSVNTVTIAGYSGLPYSNLIDGASTFVLDTENQSITIQAFEENWYIVNLYNP